MSVNNLSDETNVIAGRGFLTPHILWRPLPLMPKPPFFKFCPPLPTFPVTSKPHPQCSFCCLVSLFEWLMAPHLICLILLNIMDLHMSSLTTLMCALCNKVSSLLRSDTECFLLVLWFDITHTNTHKVKDTQHTQGPVDWHTHINIYFHQLLCAHSSYLYYTEWIIHWYQQFTLHNVFSVQKWFTCWSHICWLDAIYIRLGSSCETQIILTEMV